MFSCGKYLAFCCSYQFFLSNLFECNKLTRMVSLMRPFKKLKVRNLVIVVMVYSVFSTGHLIWGQKTGAVQMIFFHYKIKMYYISSP